MNGAPRTLLLSLATMAAYLLAALPNVLQPRGAGDFVWLSSGVAIAAIVLGGHRLAPALFVAAFAAEWLRGPMLPAAALAVAATAEALAAAWLIGRVPGFRANLERPRDVLAVLLIGALACALGAALATGFGQPPGFAAALAAWLHAWSSHTQGALFVAPFLFTWLSGRSERLGEREMLAAGLLLGAAAAMGLLGFSGMLGTTASQYLMWYALFPLLVSSATWLRPRETATVNLAVLGVAMWVVPAGSLATFSPVGPLLLQGFLAVAAVTTLVLSATTSEYRRSERELADSEQRFRSLTSLSADWFWEQDATGRFTFVSPRFFERFNIEPREFLGRSRQDIERLGPAAGGRDEYLAVFEGREPYRDLLLQRVDADGRTRYISSSGEPVFGPGRKFRGFRGVGRDITAAVEAQEALRASEARFAKIFHASPNPISISDYDSGRFLDVNEAWLAMMRYARDEVIGRTAAELGMWADPAD